MAVVLVVIDGLRPDAIVQANTPQLDRMMRMGAYTLTAQSLMPTITLPCHMAMFYSVPATRHGVLSNDYHPPVHPLTGLYEQIKSANKRSAVYYGWDILRDLSKPLTITRTHHVDIDFDNLAYTDHGLIEAALPHIAAGDYDFYFVHLDAVDEIGHHFGWMSSEYLRQVEIVDELMGQLAGALPSDSQIMIQSDHGGHDRMHGTDSPEDMTIPWLIYGHGVRQ